tara:strand:- start:5417 stop:5836 length:420 start_codon:yes stop_codon:yes gene_type:complete
MRFNNLVLLFLLVSIVQGDVPKKENKKDPKVAFYYSLIPGMGQAYNRKWLKSVMIIGLEVSSYSAWVNNRKIYNSYDTGNYSLKRHRYLEKRNKYAWWLGMVYIYGMIDSIVDAHLHKFDNLMESPLEEIKREEIKNEE